jgi:hypothetical protein
VDINFFEAEIKRLKDQWPTSYGIERQKMFFVALRNSHQIDFHDAVSYCLARCRTAPLLGELTEAVVKMKMHRKERERYDNSNRDRDGILAALQGASQVNKSADPEFVLKCMRAVSDLHRKKITKKQFDSICDDLDREAEVLTRKKGTYEDPDSWKNIVQEATDIVAEQERQKRDKNKNPFFDDSILDD